MLQRVIHNIYLWLVLICLSSIGMYGGNTPSYFVDNGVAQKEVIEQTIKSQTTNQVFQVVSHGKPGQLLLAGEWKNAAEIADYLKPMISNSFTKINHVNIYACNFARGSVGEDAVSYLENVLGVTIAASNDITGRDGNWTLEVGQPLAAFAVLGYEGNLQGTYPNCTYGIASKSQYAISANTATVQTGANYFGANGAPDILDNLSNIAENRLRFGTPSSFAAQMRFGDPIVPGDTITVWLSALTSTAPNFTVALLSSSNTLYNVSTNSVAVTSGTTTAPYVPVTVVVPAGATGIYNEVWIWVIQEVFI